MSDDWDWYPPTFVQHLARLNGYRPNDGAMGVNFEKGDRNAQDEQFPIAPTSVALTDERIAELIEDIAERGRQYVAKWKRGEQ